MGNRVFTEEIVEEIMSLIETNLKVSLDLQGIYRGNMAWLPPEAVSDLVNGVWINLVRSVEISESELPKCLLTTYPIRLILALRIDLTNNALDTKMQKVEELIDLIYDNFRMSSLSLTNSQVLWWLPRSIEYEPAEDAFVAALSADLMAVAIESDIVVRSKIS